jgi:hypothetical protein
MPDVVITVAQDSYPLDEFINVVFETLNSKGEDRFRAIVDKARAGRIARGDFAREVFRVEFDAVKTTQELLRQVKLSKKEIGKSHNYHYLFETPNDFEGYLSYVAKLFPADQSPLRKYELYFDQIRKSEAKEPNPQAGVDAGQPSGSKTNQTSSAAAPRGSP